MFSFRNQSSSRFVTRAGLSALLLLVPFSSPAENAVVQPRHATPVFAPGTESTPLTSHEATAVQVAVRTHTLLLEMAELLQKDQLEHGNLGSERLAATLRETTRRILAEYEAAGLEREKRDTVWKALRHIDFGSLAQRVLGLKRWAVKLGRTHGVPAVAAMALGTVLDFAVPTALVGAGASYLIPLSLVMPYRLLIFAPASAIARRWRDSRLAEVYGGHRALKQVRWAYQSAREKLGLTRGPTDVLIPFYADPENVLSGAIVSESSWLAWAKEKLGYPPRLTYKNILALLKQQKRESDFTRAVKADRRLSDSAKATLLLQHIDSLGDSDLVTRLRLKFSESFVPLAGKPQADAVIQWAVRAARARSVANLHRAFDRVPPGVDARIIARVWAEVVLPTILESAENLTYAEFNELKLHASQMLARAEKNPGVFSSKWRHHFHESLNEILIADCRRGFEKLTR